jgi:predicted ATPase
MVDDLAALLEEGKSRLITLTGPGGVGKTRVALAVARRAAPWFSGGAVFVDLASITKPELVASTIAQTLGIRETGDRPLLRILQDALDTRPPLLLLLDNFEQVIEAAPVVSDLLAGAPLLRILVTSRETLHIRSEHEVVVQPLDLPTDQDAGDFDRLAKTPAIALFVDAAKSVKPGFALTTDNALAVTEICRRVDGLPLATELAATRVRIFPPAMLLEHLDRRLPVLTGGLRDLPARQQTLRDTIAWSYDLLTPVEQVLFRRLGVFVGGATLPEIEAIIPAAGDLAFDLLGSLASLADKSLLRQVEDVDGSTRFLMLETVREFALDVLRQNNEHDSIQKRHGSYFLDCAETYCGNLTWQFGDFQELDRVEADIENIRAAIAWYQSIGDVAACARFGVVMWNYFFWRGLYHEGNALCHGALALSERSPLSDKLRGRLLATLCHQESILGNPVRGEALGREGLALLRRLPEERELFFFALFNLVIALREQKRFAEAIGIAEQVRNLANQLGNELRQAIALYQVGKLARLLGDLERAVTMLDESLSRGRKLKLTVLAHFVSQNLAVIRIRRGELKEAAALLHEADRPLHSRLFRGQWESGFHVAAALAIAASRREAAAQLLGFETAYEKSFGLVPDTDPWMEEAFASLRDDLGEATYDAAFRQGLEMDLGDAVSVALGVLESVEPSTESPPPPS